MVIESNRAAGSAREYRRRRSATLVYIPKLLGVASERCTALLSAFLQGRIHVLDSAVEIVKRLSCLLGVHGIIAPFDQGFYLGQKPLA